MQLLPSHMFITLLTHKHTLSYTQQWDPGVEDINTLETESVLSPEANCVSLQSFTTVTPGYPNVSFICTAQWREVCIRAFCWGRLSFFTIQHCDTGWYTHGNGRKVWLFTATKLDLHIAPLEGVINLLEWSVVNPICGLKRQQESDLTSTTTEVRSVRGGGLGICCHVCWTKQSASRKRERKMSDKRLVRKETQQQPPWRPRERPKLPSSRLWAKAFARSPPPQISRAASHGVGWAYVDHLGSPRETQTNERVA